MLTGHYCYQLKNQIRADAQFYAQLAEAKPDLKIENMHPKLITGLKRDLRSDLKNLLENIYTYIACAVHAVGKSENKRRSALKAMGFELPANGNGARIGIDPNDLAILFMYLLIVIPSAAFFAHLVLGGQMPRVAFIYVVWTLMAISVGLISVVVPTLCKQMRENADSRFWRIMRPRRGGHPWFAYLLSSSTVALTSVLVMTLLSYLTPNLRSYNFLTIAKKILPWGLVPAALSFMLCFHLERKESGKKVYFVEGLTTSLAAVIAGIAALALSLNILDWEELVKQMYFSIPAAALLGLIIGSIFPHRYRLQASETLILQLDTVNLKAVIENSIRKFKDRAESDRIQITMKVADNIPKLKLDPVRIDQAITSLIANAIEFTPEGGRIDVSAEVTDKQGIRLRVNDSGIGMTEKQVYAVNDAPKNKIGEAWVNAESRNGFDLHQIRFIVEEHGGRFNLKSSLLEGTDVTIELPDHLKVDVTSPVHQEEPEEYQTKPLAA